MALPESGIHICWPSISVPSVLSCSTPAFPPSISVFCFPFSVSFCWLMGDRYFRVEAHLTKEYKLDDVSLMNEYEDIWFKHWLANRDAVKEWLNK